MVWHVRNSFELHLMLVVEKQNNPGSDKIKKYKNKKLNKQRITIKKNYKERHLKKH